jgi:hypothetical protein
MISNSTPTSQVSTSRKPRPTAPAIYGHGHYVGVRINKYETKAQARARGQGNIVCYSLSRLVLEMYLNYHYFLWPGVLRA